ncbi:uncharacterized protein LOC131246819 [Magnolia sinica]|uniref:uncharacterized protein LOC131246819 n=1 Tax=Magnolia sinica TaxID=86752 RepID=UPI002658B7DE|nr:uncharacterized protein LOC131246819 [Magnolia sinica]XP_058103224.1 uncharacterized protein LOC131246819 [Magnolia sinica]XP_058103225.1 uncharacterized protein LOC131246819 [Magnolia sinica]XP_058103226.1 uncharacterized protein LOC131246819 [Magnolia sinica]
MSMRRKKWTEEEERTLIEKYASMVSDGSLPKLKTREKKFRPIASHVNSVHHHRDPMAFPFQWSWKDASTKVQNMRHQYLLVKQKIKKPGTADSGGAEEFDWDDGLSHWPNFLRYKEVFGDVELGPTDLVGPRRLMGGAVRIGGPGCSVDGSFGVGFDMGENGVLGFDYEGEEGDGDDGFEYEEAGPTGSTPLSRKKRKRLEKQASSAFLSSQLVNLKQWEARLESRDAEKERERLQREEYRTGLEEVREKEREAREQLREKSRREWAREWELMEECFERERQRREEAVAKDREWEDRMDRRRLEWKKRMDGMMSQHQALMDRIHSRIIHEQQTVANQLLELVSHWTGHSAGLSDHTGGPYVSQMMQNLHHANGLVHGENRVRGDSHDDQFIVDG